MKGLNNKEVITSRNKFGTNALSKKESESLFSKFIEGFKDKMIMILLFALLVDILFVFLGQAEWYEAVGIAVAVLIANLVSVISEYKNESKFQELQDEASKILCKVYRNDKLIEIPIDDIVVDDIVKLETGDKIPADGFVILGKIKVDQSTLNGESEEVVKCRCGSITNITNLSAMDTLFRGTVVTQGECEFKVGKVGDDTIYGKLNKEMQEDTRPSPLKVKLGILADQISLFGRVGACLIALAYLIVSGFTFKNLLDSIILAVTIIVMAVPEGLPMMIALVLSMNMSKMLKDNVLVRKINGIETAGGLNILFTDKTGTLTEGKLKVVEIVNYQLNKLTRLGQDAIIGIGLNNSSTISENKVIGGNSTDRCLMQYILDQKYDTNMPNTKLIKEVIPFDSKNKYSKINYNDFEYIKGAPEKIIDLCELDNKTEILDYITNQCSKAMRLIAVAVKDLHSDNSKYNLVCIISIRDDIRKEVKQAVVDVRNAGVQVVMVTGDNKETARAIAHECGLISSTCGENLLGKEVYTHDELELLTDEDLKLRLKNIKVVARALPSDKSRLVKLAQELDLVVGMTGDGVNDSPALKKADVGFAMGSGTDVAKEAGDIVILDDNFSSIKKAILYGRTIFKSIRKFIIFQLTVNVAAVSLCFIAPLLGIAEPLTIIQILWINLIMDTLAAIAFGGEPSLSRYLKEKPINRTESILTKSMIIQILEAGLFTAIISLLILISKLPDKETIMFAFFIFTTIFNGFNARTEQINLFDNISKNKRFLYTMLTIAIIQVIMVTIGGNLLRTTPLSMLEWVFTLELSFSIIIIDLIRKVFFRRNHE